MEWALKTTEATLYWNDGPYKLSSTLQVFGLVPLHQNRPRRLDRAFLEETVENKLDACKRSLLTVTGRLAPVNVAFGAISVCGMFTFKILSTTIEKIDLIRRRFLWRDNKSYHGGHGLLNWEKVGRPKQFGGLRVTNIKLLNHFLLTKCW